MHKIDRLAEASIPAEYKRQATERQSQLLVYLFRNEGQDVYQRDVEAEFSISRATASQMLTAMERSGLITRTGVAGDARLKRLAVTEKARAHMGRVWEGMQEFERTLTRGMSEEEQAALLALLRRVEENADSAMLSLRNRKEY